MDNFGNADGFLTAHRFDRQWNGKGRSKAFVGVWIVFISQIFRTVIISRRKQREDTYLPKRKTELSSSPSLGRKKELVIVRKAQVIRVTPSADKARIGRFVTWLSCCELYRAAQAKEGCGMPETD